MQNPGIGNHPNMSGKRKSHCGICGGQKSTYGGYWCCPVCYRQYQREHWARSGRNTPKRAAQNRANMNKIRSSGLANWKVYQIKKYYGITEDEYIALRNKQKNLCAICKKSLPDSLHIDHCHKTNAVRGMLCFSCNSGMGHFSDDPVKLRAAARYLIKSLKTQHANIKTDHDNSRKHTPATVNVPKVSRPTI